MLIFAYSFRPENDWETVLMTHMAKYVIYGKRNRLKWQLRKWHSYVHEVVHILYFFIVFCLCNLAHFHNSYKISQRFEFSKLFIVLNLKVELDLRTSINDLQCKPKLESDQIANPNNWYWSFDQQKLIKCVLKFNYQILVLHLHLYTIRVSEGI